MFILEEYNFWNVKDGVARPIVGFSMCVGSNIDSKKVIHIQNEQKKNKRMSS